MGRGIFVKQNGTWVEVKQPSYNNAGSYENITKGFVRVNGIWQQFFPVTGNIEWTVPGAYIWKVPNGINMITVELCGGGGGGGERNGTIGGNGGSGVSVSISGSSVTYAGAFFQSQNSQTWVPSVGQTLCFDVNICDFAVGSATVQFNSNASDYKKL